MTYYCYFGFETEALPTLPTGYDVVAGVRWAESAAGEQERQYHKALTSAPPWPGSSGAKTGSACHTPRQGEQKRRLKGCSFQIKSWATCTQ